MTSGRKAPADSILDAFEAVSGRLFPDYDSGMIKHSLCIVSLIAVGALVAPTFLRAQTPATRSDEESWIEAMRKTHARFRGTTGTLAQFGDSITVSMAYWASLSGEPKGLSREGTAARDRVKGYMQAACWREWKGSDYGSEGRMTIRWADENVAKWLKQLNPETAVIMFGTNDLGQVPLEEYDRKTREVVDRCLANGTVVILSTIPPRSGQVELSERFSAVARNVAKDKNLPLIDFYSEVLKRRPKDWDGSQAPFKGQFKDVYEVPTLISGDGVHPSNPKSHQEFSEDGLKANGFALRSYLTLMAYARVIDEVFKPSGKK
jgi:lysophospholipase L1-like esterase